MRYAIDRFRIGSEEEVDADYFYNKFIPRRQDRFFCPECGEIVYWRSKGGTHPNQFYHKVKTERSPECDKRVDGRSGLNLYERIGLPIFLTPSFGEHYLLNIGFPPVGANLLNQAAAYCVKINIIGGARQRAIYINQTNFYDNVTTLVPIDFIPTYSKNYKIQIESSNTPFALRNKWADYADGFDIGGAIFTYEETGGKKIRRGDGISPNRQYYIVAKTFSPSYSEISSRVIGEIMLNGEKYTVYRMTINVTANDEKSFLAISNFFKSRFGVCLLETFPEVIPLWPPVVEQDAMVPVLKGRKIYCGVSSGNAIPNVYGYSGSDTYLLPLKHERQECKVIEIPASMKETIISVDRKYVGREIVFKQKNIEWSSFSYEIILEDDKGTDISMSAITQEILSSELLIKANAKMELYIGSMDNTYQHIVIAKNTVVVRARKNSVILYFLVEDGVFLCRETIQVKHLDFDELIYHKKIKQAYHGKMVPVPRWAMYLLYNCKATGNLMLAESIAEAIHGSKIYVGVLKVLMDLRIDIVSKS